MTVIVYSFLEWRMLKIDVAQICSPSPPKMCFLLSISEANLSGGAFVNYKDSQPRFDCNTLHFWVQSSVRYDYL